MTGRLNWAKVLLYILFFIIIVTTIGAWIGNLMNWSWWTVPITIVIGAVLLGGIEAALYLRERCTDRRE